ncbi:phage virion morphogenesis protein [Campylobacter sp. RM9334]|uniref:phage virion morphogenesis protein n=1 Tax=Campylobacter sp. RM9334 TaxID=2735732 RepID=UPI001E00F3DD|nr:phage virion morphogenesis protein [Campylobacter sp. RM9334]
MNKEFEELTGILKDLANLQGSELLTRANSNMASTLLKDIEDCFENESDAKGNKWAKRKDKKDHKLLFNTGDLGNHWDTKADNKGFFVFNNRGKSKSGFSYGLSHQFGSKNGIPARPFLPIKGETIENAELNDEIKQKILKELENTIKRALKISK